VRRVTRRLIWWWLSALVAASAVGCGLFKKAAHAVTPQADPPEVTRWNGVLFEPTDTAADTASMPYGTAWMAPMPPNNVIRAHVAVLRARPGARFDWRVHIGTCFQDRGVFGPPMGYPVLVADSLGRATGETVLLLGFPNRGAYFVRVTAIDSGPPDDVCGTLLRPE
jgi:hypothetical protein